MACWFECKVRYDKMQENGSMKKVTETYLCDAFSITEAVARTTKELEAYISGDYSVSSSKSTKIAEIIPISGETPSYVLSTDEARWYLVKVAFITIDEKTAAEKRSISQVLVEAYNFRNAFENFVNSMKSSMADYAIVSINETAYMEVYSADLSSDKETKE